MTGLKPLLRNAVETALGERVLRLLEQRPPADGRHFQVLTYHRITDAGRFARQVAYLAENYDVLSMPDLLMALVRNQPLSPRALLITFDDAYTDFAEKAWPALRQFGLPVTLFVPTGFPDRPDRFYWWDQLEHALKQTGRRDTWHTPIGSLPLDSRAARRRALRQLKGFLWSCPPGSVAAWVDKFSAELDVSRFASEVLGWTELRRLAAEGVTLGAHTRTHPNLALLPAGQAMQEVAGSLQDLEEQVETALPIFAYPGGHYSAETMVVLQEAGVQLAFTSRRGTNDVNRTAWLELRRNNVGPAATRAVLRARLVHASPYIDRFRQAWRGS